MTTTQTRFFDELAKLMTNAAGAAQGPVHRAQQVGIALDEDQRLALVEGVVAQGDRIGTRGEKAEEDVLGDAKAVGGVLAVHHHKVGAVTLLQQGKLPRQCVTARPADHIAKKDQPHAKVSCSVIT